MKTTVLLVDAHKMVREGLKAVLQAQPNLEVVGEAEDGRQALDLASELRPDVVVMDVGLPGLNGIEATRRLVDTVEGVHIVALSMHADRRYVTEMLSAGAGAYILKNSAAEELIRAIRAVTANESFLSPEITATVIQQITRGAPAAESSAYGVLSTREREVLQLLAEGQTSKQIASELHLAVRTVETHRRGIMHKLDLHSVAELTKYAVREGLTTLEA